jgi:restriction system protein
MVPQFQTYLFPFLKVVENGEVMSTKTIAEKLAVYLHLSEDDLKTTLESGGSRHLNRTQWAKTYCLKAGLVHSPKRGHVVISNAGKELLLSGITEITQRFLIDHYPSFAEFAKHKKTETAAIHYAVGESIDESTPLEKIESAYKEILNSTIDDLLQEVKTQTPQFFEELVVNLLVKMGYGGDFEGAAKVTQFSSDGGIDGIIKEDTLGLDKIYIQAKRWTEKTVGSQDIQQFIGALINAGAAKGIYITTSKYSEGAKNQAVNSPHVKIVLIDGEELARYMIKYNLGVVVDRVFSVKRIDLGYFHPED